jgi:hypothetical protein
MEHIDNTVSGHQARHSGYSKDIPIRTAPDYLSCPTAGTDTGFTFASTIEDPASTPAEYQAADAKTPIGFLDELTGCQKAKCDPEQGLLLQTSAVWSRSNRQVHAMLGQQHGGSSGNFHARTCDRPMDYVYMETFCMDNVDVVER